MAKAAQFPPAKEEQSASRKRVSKPLREIAVHPSLAADVRRLIAQHGREAVQEAIRKETKRNVGRPVKPDRYLVELLTPDAERWLENITPFAVETDNAIAKKAEKIYPDTNSNINSGSQKTRILIRLRERRPYYTLVLA